MTDVAIRVQGLGKKFRVAGPRERYRTLRDSLAAAAAPGRLLGRRRDHGGQEFWALRNVSFEIAHGEVVGLIGRNGAGKSTLLKILSRISEPTEGCADLYGRIGSLLEVGTGFHPELSGRENIYLNGAILGMRRAEIARKLDEIVAFAEVERFLDTPVKHYSSGMYLRLAFAVAAHLETEILLVDEVLAVGDMAFQKRCLGKMGEVAKAGRTVLLVSHNMAAISGLCHTTALLDRGLLCYYGPTDAGVATYVTEVRRHDPACISQRTDRHGSGRIRILDVALIGESGTRSNTVRCGERIVFALRYTSTSGRCLANSLFEIKVADLFGQLLFTLSTHLTGQTYDKLPPDGMVYCEVPKLLATPDDLVATVIAYDNNELADLVRDAFRFTVVDGDVYHSTKPPRKSIYGAFATPQRWYGPDPVAPHADDVDSRNSADHAHPPEALSGCTRPASVSERTPILDKQGAHHLPQ